MKKRMTFEEFLKTLEGKVGEFRQAREIEKQAPESPAYKKRREKWLKSGEVESAYPYKTPEGEKALLLALEIMELIHMGDKLRLRLDQLNEYIRALRRMLKQMPKKRFSPFAPMPVILDCCLKMKLIKRNQAEKRAGQ